MNTLNKNATLTYLKNIFIDKLISIYYFSIRVQRKKSHRLCNESFFTLKSIARYHLESSEKYDDSQKINSITHVLSLRLLDSEYFSEERPKIFPPISSERENNFIKEIISIYEENQNTIDQLEDCLKEKTEVKNLQEIYFTTKSYLHSLIKSEDEKNLSKYYLEKAQKINPRASAANYSDLEKHKRYVNKVNKEISHLLEDRKSIKLNIKSSDVTNFVAISTSGLIISAFLYNKNYYEHFGIKLSSYFSIGDYLSGSIEGLFSSGINLFISTCALYLGMRHGYTKSATHSQTSIKEVKKDYFYILSILAILMLLISGYYAGGKIYNTSIYFSLIILSTLVIPTISRNFFEKSTAALVTIFMICTWTAHVYKESSNDIIDIETKIASVDYSECNNFSFSEEIRKKLNSCDYIFIGSSSNYAFFASKNREDSIALNREEVKFYSNKIPEKERNFIQKTIDISEKILRHITAKTKETENTRNPEE
ncbi:hypothetical protein [Thalassospira xiamenensis]|uniref:hypothetical protein n=1 Tax=Thalassospira xiamenensis TaxID=220697 RepID=UPI000DED83C4|nr:hypothetical protein [Thalassospira xiamenensis]